MRNVALAMNEAIGAVGIICPTEAPLLGFLSLVMPAIVAGNTVVAVPSERYATIIGDLYQVFDTSDLPGGVVNIVAGRPAELAKTLAEHDDIDAGLGLPLSVMLRRGAEGGADNQPETGLYQS